MTPAIFNTTPFAQQCMLLMDKDGQLAFCMLVCATYCFDEAGEPYPAPVQVPVPLADEPHGEAGKSSLRRASVASMAKPAVDFVLDAAAHAPHGRSVTQLAVGVRVGEWSKVLNVTGDRDWGGALGNAPSSPRPFTTMPLRWERAFGGSVFDEAGALRACHPENPLGVGWRKARCVDPMVQSALPNIALAGRTMNAPTDDFPIAGFGAVAPNWAPRARYAGTYDQAWLDSRFPVPPIDYDLRFAQSAPLDQQWTDARPGAQVQLGNLTPEGQWQFRMPAPALSATVLHGGGMDRHRLRVDTIHIDAHAKTVSLIARHCLTDLRRLGLVREVLIGEASPGWLRARRDRKRYIGRDAPALAD
jgi:hypothetical protein